MDKSEENLDDRLGGRLGDRDGKTQRDSEGETEKEVSAMCKGYNVGLTDKEYDISPPKLELASEFRRHRLSPPHPPHTMDISSVRYRPVPVMAQAVLTSTYGHPRLELAEMGKVNICTRSVGFDVCREEEREKKGTSRRLDMDDLTNRGIEVTKEEMEKKLSELKR